MWQWLYVTVRTTEPRHLNHGRNVSTPSRIRDPRLLPLMRTGDWLPVFPPGGTLVSIRGEPDSSHFNRECRGNTSCSEHFVRNENSVFCSCLFWKIHFKSWPANLRRSFHNKYNLPVLLLCRHLSLVFFLVVLILTGCKRMIEMRASHFDGEGWHRWRELFRPSCSLAYHR